ncbi:MAG: fimbria/pilus outer membrane usher protein [Holosporaceae bacterium]|jgi:outer membrane usher protein FimD/PapC|nr:fimbria/pilus outer membrane usher protein [Holosporaceae bacterium]
MLEKRICCCVVSVVFVIFLAIGTMEVGRSEDSVTPDDPVAIGRAPADSAYEEDVDLYAKVFGSSYKRKDALLELSIVLDGEKIGEAMTFIGKGNKIHANSLVELLDDYLIPTETGKILSLNDADGFLSFERLESLGIGAKFNRQLLQVELTAPVEYKKTRSLGKRYTGNVQKPNVRQANVSGFVNVRASGTCYQDKSSYNHRSLIFSPVLNVYGLVLEGEVSHDHVSNSKGKKGFRREYTSLVYDWAEEHLVFRGGDIFGRSARYQSVPRLFGLQIKKEATTNYECGSARALQITLPRRSTIKVYFNGNLVKVEEGVAPGTYELDDISYSNGANDVKIKIVDDAGRERTLEESFFLENAFVRRGEFDFDCSAGYPEVNDPKKGRYDRHNRVISLSVKYGLLDATEIGGGVENSKLGTAYAMELRNKNVCGNFDMKYARSSYNCKIDHDSCSRLVGNAYFLSYSTPSIRFYERSSFSCGVSFEESDSFFYPYLAPGGNLFNSSDFLKTRQNIKGKRRTISYFAFVSNLFTLNFNANYRVKTNPKRRSGRSLSVNISKNMPLGGETFSSASFNALFERSKNFDGKINRSLGLSCSVYLKNDVRISSSYVGAEEKNAYLSVSQTPRGNGFGYDVHAARAYSKSNYGINGSYAHPMFRAELDHSRRGSSVNSTRLGLETALFFADGNFAVARRLSTNGGFIMATPVKAMKNETIKFVDNGVESDPFGNAVVPTSRNHTTTARLDLLDVPDTLDVRPHTLIAVGKYNRGALAEISAEGSYMAEGYLCYQDGSPMAMVSGYALHRSDGQAKPVQFFTNSVGKFVITNLKPGEYDVSVSVEGIMDFEIEIAESAHQYVIKLGKIICREKVEGKS